MKYTIEKDRVLTYFVNTGAVGKTGERGPKGETGPMGPMGPAGEDAYTPVKGVDYWTDGDREQIINDVLSHIPNLNGESF